ncbi:hypothetical protein AUC69_03470 [Methyloceanibacter superfactus]|uniref:Uncharacterized protein n=1 Tax=Methyloceanibacter superfactus TaxID=1774969 RepID=A0A1E3VKZ9_9HYPH|nr:hypothetical protein [Methyloceanibacter superfactus]ODR94220.1 hypothetical protein AUC69_03470 [Methyloceanibacter superfactus]
MSDNDNNDHVTKAGSLALRYVQKCADTWLAQPMPLAPAVKEQALAESMLLHGVALFSEGRRNAPCAELLRHLADNLAETPDAAPPTVN